MSYNKKSLRDYSFVHPTLFFESNSYFPVTGQPNKSNFLSLGCFLLSILLNIDSEIFASFIKKKVPKINYWRKGKSKIFSMF